jgi:hypothetical protein
MRVADIATGNGYSDLPTLEVLICDSGLVFGFTILLVKNHRPLIFTASISAWTKSALNHGYPPIYTCMSGISLKMCRMSS